jgi:hypothetical protein
VTSGISPGDLDKLFAPVVSIIQAAQSPQRDLALQTTQQLKDELVKGKAADDSRLGRLVDQLAGLVPGAVSALVSAFASPVIGGLAGPVTKFVLDRIQGK